MHLWEVDHPYYCYKKNHFTDKSVCDEHDTWESFERKYRDAEVDLNLVFRWDWLEGEDWDAEPFNGDERYRNGKLLIFWMSQRLGLYRCSEVAVCRADEPAVIAFLRPRWEHMRWLWEPLSS